MGFCAKPCRKQDDGRDTKREKDNNEETILVATKVAKEAKISADPIQNQFGSEPMLIPVYPEGMPEGGVKRQRGRPKKVKSDEKEDFEMEKEPQLDDAPQNVSMQEPIKEPTEEVNKEMTPEDPKPQEEKENEEKTPEEQKPEEQKPEEKKPDEENQQEIKE